MPVRIVSKPRASSAQRAFILDGLVAYNRAQTGNGPYRPVCLFAENASGKVVGGLLGFIWGRWLHVNIFWISEHMRGQDVGSKLLAMAEAKARAAGCSGSSLDTFSFQARPFYEKQGYQVFGTLKGFPAGHTQYFLAKRFGAAPRKKVAKKRTNKSPMLRSAKGTSRGRG